MSLQSVNERSEVRNLLLCALQARFLRLFAPCGRSRVTFAPNLNHTRGRLNISNVSLFEV